MRSPDKEVMTVIAHDTGSLRPQVPACGSCDGGLVPTEVDTQLYVRLSGEGTDAAWTTTPLQAWTCLTCGRTELLAEEPGRSAS